MTRLSISILLALSVFATSPSVSRSEDLVSKKLRRMRLPTMLSSRSTGVFILAKLLVLNRSRAEFALTQDQGERIDGLLGVWSEREVALNKTPLGSGPGEVGLSESATRRLRNEARTLESEKILEGLREILTPQQYERLNQLVLQKLGLNAVFVREPLIEKLNLDEAQLTQIRKLRGIRRPANNKELSRHQQFLELLTRKQRIQWDQLIGEPFFPPPSQNRVTRVISPNFRDVPSRLSLVKYESVRTALKLTDEQQNQIADAVVAWLDARLSWDEQLIAGADGEDLKRVLGRIPPAVETATIVLESALTESQMSRLGQLRLQRAGIYVFKNPQVVQELNLSDEQRQKISTLTDELVSIANFRKRSEARPQLFRESLNVLTDEQRQKLKQLLGESVEIPLE